MTFEAVNLGTTILGLALWPAMGMYELFLLWRRGIDIRVKTISMVMAKLAWRLNLFPALWGGMATHWWWPGSSHARVETAVAFWALIAAVFAFDGFVWVVESPDPKRWPKWLRWLRFPFLWLVVGALAGLFLFAQKGEWP